MSVSNVTISNISLLVATVIPDSNSIIDSGWLNSTSCDTFYFVKWFRIDVFTWRWAESAAVLLRPSLCLDWTTAELFVILQDGCSTPPPPADSSNLCSWSITVPPLRHGVNTWPVLSLRPRGSASCLARPMGPPTTTPPPPLGAGLGTLLWVWRDDVWFW